MSRIYYLTGIPYFKELHECTSQLTKATCACRLHRSDQVPRIDEQPVQLITDKHGTVPLPFGSYFRRVFEQNV